MKFLIKIQQNKTKQLLLILNNSEHQKLNLKFDIEEAGKIIAYNEWTRDVIKDEIADYLDLPEFECIEMKNE